MCPYLEIANSFPKQLHLTSLILSVFVILQLNREINNLNDELVISIDSRYIQRNFLNIFL